MSWSGAITGKVQNPSETPGIKILEVSRRMNDVQQAQLWQALQGKAPDGGLWNGRKVADWMSELLGRLVLPQRGWEYLRGMRYRLRSPRPEHEAS